MISRHLKNMTRNLITTQCRQTKHLSVRMVFHSDIWHARCTIQWSWMTHVDIGIRDNETSSCYYYLFLLFPWGNRVFALFFSLYFLANFFVQVLNQIQFPSLFRIFFPVSILIHRYCLIKLCLRYLIPADIE